MEIISKKQDYYDFVPKVYGVDKKVIFRRDEEFTEFDLRKDKDFHIVRKLFSETCYGDISYIKDITCQEIDKVFYIPVLIVFAKRMYMYIKSINGKGNESFITDWNKANQIAKRGRSKSNGKPWGEKLTAGTQSLFDGIPIDLEGIHVFSFAKISVWDDRPMTKSHTTNPLLVNYGFQHVLSPYQAYQNLYMVESEKCNVEVDSDFSDDIKRRSKGFIKESFKSNHPSRVSGKT